MILVGNGGSNLLVSSEIRFVRCFCESRLCSLRSCFSTFFVGSIWHFESVLTRSLFIWDGLGHELIPSIEGCVLIPHEFIDRGELSSMVEKLGFIVIFHGLVLSWGMIFWEYPTNNVVILSAKFQVIPSWFDGVLGVKSIFPENCSKIPDASGMNVGHVW
jgi:hypothetical protein